MQHVELLEGKVCGLTEQLDRQYEISKSADRRAKRMEGDYLSLEGRLQKVEDEANSGDVLREELRHDKERVRQFLFHTISVKILILMLHGVWLMQIGKLFDLNKGLMRYVLNCSFSVPSVY